MDPIFRIRINLQDLHLFGKLPGQTSDWYIWEDLLSLKAHPIPLPQKNGDFAQPNLTKTTQNCGVWVWKKQILAILAQPWPGSRFHILYKQKSWKKKHSAGCLLPTTCAKVQGTAWRGGWILLFFLRRFGFGSFFSCFSFGGFLSSFSRFSLGSFLSSFSLLGFFVPPFSNAILCLKQVIRLYLEKLWAWNCWAKNIRDI